MPFTSDGSASSRAGTGLEVAARVWLQGGLSVAQAAGRLEVSEPTIRKWLAEGLLERVEVHKPLEITQRSVIEVERVLGTIRESYPARPWSEALAAFLRDRDLLKEGRARALSSIDMESWLGASLSHF